MNNDIYLSLLNENKEPIMEQVIPGITYGFRLDRRKDINSAESSVAIFERTVNDEDYTLQNVYNQIDLEKQAIRYLKLGLSPELSGSIINDLRIFSVNLNTYYNNRIANTIEENDKLIERLEIQVYNK